MKYLVPMVLSLGPKRQKQNKKEFAAEIRAVKFILDRRAPTEADAAKLLGNDLETVRALLLEHLPFTHRSRRDKDRIWRIIRDFYGYAQ